MQSQSFCHTIPRKIHLVWFGSNLPPLFAALADRVRFLHPDWEVRLWDEAMAVKLIRSMGTGLDTQFQSSRLTLSTKSDLVRYHIVALEGGIYLDTDFLILKSLDSLRTASLFGVHEDPGTLCSGVFGAVSGHAVFSHVFDRLRRSNYSLPPNLLAGPGMFSPICRQCAARDPQARLLSSRSFFPVPLGKKYDLSAWRTCRLDQSYGAHLWAHSWGEHGGDAENLLRARVEALLENSSAKRSPIRAGVRS